MMKNILALAAVAILGSACVSTGSIDTAIRQSLPQICAAADVGYAAFKPLADAGKIKASTVTKVETSYSQIVAYCSNKDTATLASTLVAASTAYAVITTALREARNVQQ